MAGVDICPTISGDPAVIFADGGYSTFMDLAPQAFDRATQFAEQMTAFYNRPTQFNADFNFDAELTPFVRPPRPELDAGGFAFNVPAAPSAPPTFTPQTVDASPAPVFNTPDPTIVIPSAPETPTDSMPEAPARAAPLVIPLAPDYQLPEVPTMESLNLPAVPTINLPTFDSQRPDFIEPELNENWAWDPTPYTSDLLTKVKAKVSLMMDGHFGLEPIEQLIFQRARSRLDVETRRTIDTRVNEFANRGWEEPNGILRGAIDEILQTGLTAKAAQNETVAIESYKELLVNVRQGIQNGIALEQVATNLHIQEQQLALRAAEFQRETAIAILNARVSVFNARMGAYSVDAQVFQTRIQAALASVELYRAQLEGEKVKGELNQQKVAIYSAQLQAVQTMAEFYRTQILAVQAQADIEKTVIERFRAEVDAYGERWKAYGEQVGAFKAQIEAQNIKATVHRSLVDAYAARTQAWGTAEGNKIALAKLNSDQNGQQIAAWRGQLDLMLGLVQGEAARISALGQRADAQARIYTADAGVETAASAAADRSLQIGFESENARVQAALKDAEVRIQENIQRLSLLMDARRTQAQVMAQLAASAMSSMNFSASVSSSRSQSKSCSSSVGWTGEAPDLK